MMDAFRSPLRTRGMVTRVVLGLACLAFTACPGNVVFTYQDLYATNHIVGAFTRNGMPTPVDSSFNVPNVSTPGIIRVLKITGISNNQDTDDFVFRSGLVNTCTGNVDNDIHFLSFKLSAAPSAPMYADSMESITVPAKGSASTNIHLVLFCEQKDMTTQPRWYGSESDQWVATPPSQQFKDSMTVSELP